MAEDEWFNDRGELAAVGRALIDAGCFTDPVEMLDFIEKPWKWSVDRDVWFAAGRPYLSDPGWELFQVRIDALEHSR